MTVCVWRGYWSFKETGRWLSCRGGLGWGTEQSWYALLAYTSCNCLQSKLYISMTNQDHKVGE